MSGGGRGRLRTARTAAVCAAAVVLGIMAGCGDGGGLPKQPAGTTGLPAAGAPELARIRWDASAVAAAAPALVGWREDMNGSAGSLVALTEGSATTDGVRELWRAPEGLEVDLIALDAAGERVAMLLTVADESRPSGSRRALAVAGPQGTAEARLPEDADVVTAAFASDGRLIVVAATLGPTSIETTLGGVAADGSWQSVRLAGEVPTHHFVERVMAVEGTDAIALVLKTPGAPGNRDDEALVLATLEGDELGVYTPPFFDDSLPSASPFDGDEGVVYARTWREISRRPVVDLVRARFNGTEWEEAVLIEDAAIASGVETGQVAACASDGTLWLRSAGERADDGSAIGERLMRLDPASRVLEPTLVDVGSVLMWWWIGR